MPQSNKQVKFYFGTQQEYDALEVKNDSAFYIITDTRRIYLGEKIYVARITKEDIGKLGLNDIFLTVFDNSETNFSNTVPIIAQNGQLISSGKTLGKSVPENAAFLTESQVTLLQEIAENATDLQVVGQAPPYYNNNGLMSYADKEKLDRLPNLLSVATTETSGLMSAEDKEKLNSLSNIEYTIATSKTNGLMSSTDKAKLDIYPILTAPYAKYDSSTGDSSPGLMDAESIRHLKILWDNRNGGGGGGGSAIIDFEDAPRVSTAADGFMLKEDKAKLDNITGISNNTKFEFCTASEYNQMVNRTAAIYFILDDSTLLIKDANDNLLTLGNARGNNNSNNLINSINIINQSSIGTYSNPLTESEMIQNNSGE